MPRRRPHPERPRGFTLLELLVAIAILSLVAVGSYELLFSTIATRDQAMTRERGLRELQRAEMLLQRDLVQAVKRPVRDEFGDVQPGFVIPRANQMEFSRLGWRNPLQEPRSEVVRVRWLVANGRLLREHWPVLDRARTSTPVRIVLLDDVSDFHLQVFANKDWNATWPLLGSATRNPASVPPPDAVDIRFSLKPFGEVRRVIALPEQNETTSS